MIFNELKHKHLASDIKEFLETYYEVGKPTDTYKSVTGEQYLEVHKNDPDSRLVVEYIWETICMYMSVCPPSRFKLYWRIPPDVDKTPEGHLRVYLRFLLSDKPEVEHDESG